MSFYRNTYLKSDDWKTLRNAKLAKRRGKCQLCGHVSFSNDVHHVVYRRIWDVRLNDLRVLCRECHDWVHAILEQYPKLSRLPRNVIWKTIRLHWTRQERYTKKDRKRKRNRREELEINKLRRQFGASKSFLREQGLICKRRMRAWDWVITHPDIIPVVMHPFDLLSAYIEVAHRDPRRMMPVVYSQLGNPDFTGHKPRGQKMAA